MKFDRDRMLLVIAACMVVLTVVFTVSVTVQTVWQWQDRQNFKQQLDEWTDR